MSRVRIVTLAGDPEREAELASRLSHRPDVELLLRCVDRIELLATLRGGGIDAVVSVGAPPWLDGQSSREAVRAGVRIVGVVSNPIEGDLLAPLGASLVPADATIDEILERCIGDEPERPIESPEVAPSGGRLIAVWGPKGAPGRTTVAIELAAELAANHADTLLVDADTYGGDVVQLLGIVEELPTIVWAARAAAKDELDAAQLALDFRRAGRGGPVVLPGLPRSDLWADIGPNGWRRLLELTRIAFQYTVCDVGFCLESDITAYSVDGGRNRVTVETVESADHVVAVCRADPVGVKNFLWAYGSLREIADEDSILVVVNCLNAGDEGAVAELLKKHTHRRATAFIPNRSQLLARAKTSGESVREIDPGSEICAAMRSVGAAVGGRVKAHSLMARLAGRR